MRADGQESGATAPPRERAARLHSHATPGNRGGDLRLISVHRPAAARRGPWPLRISETVAPDDRELTETFSHSSGPGGQNVNTVETAAETVDGAGVDGTGPAETAGPDEGERPLAGGAGG